jgi:SPP1 gp7 family putative phage head morphogenesis protein
MEVKRIPFKEARDAFAKKAVLPEARFRSLAGEIGEERAHSVAFSVAGIAREDVLSDLLGEVQKTIDQGKSLWDFREGIDEIMERRGWAGLNPYRLDNIFRTNIQTAYAVGRYKQMMEIADRRPYWEYDAVNDTHTRPSHGAHDGKVYHYRHPFWNTWYPPNGYRCRCRVNSLSAEEMEEEGLQEETQGTDLKPDEGFRFNPGKAHWGEGLARGAIDGAQKPLKWKPLSDKGPVDFGRPTKIPYVKMPAAPGKRKAAYTGAGMSEKEAAERVRKDFHKAIGGETVQVTDAAGDPLILSDHLFEHLSLDGRETYFPLIRDLVESPFEIWLTPEQAVQTGKVRLMKRYVKFYRDEKKRGMLLVAESHRGVFSGYTFLRGDKPKYFQKYRQGQLIYGK